MSRTYSPLDQILIHLDRGMRTVFAGQTRSLRPSPGDRHAPTDLDEPESQHVAGLMRVNHTGEVCAQALYFGQAAVAQDPEIRGQMLEAAAEETDHLAWCQGRLDELGSRPSLLNPVWYAGSFAIGAVAGARGDGWNLGFVVETERQVEAHLESHLAQLPGEDQRSRAILTTMKEDEARHADQALASGGRELPGPVKRLMGLAAAVMKWVAYRV